jgi:hypothetical protein
MIEVGDVAAGLTEVPWCWAPEYSADDGPTGSLALGLGNLVEL